jgi:hypothetical protein
MMNFLARKCGATGRGVSSLPETFMTECLRSDKCPVAFTAVGPGLKTPEPAADEAVKAFVFLSENFAARLFE